MKQLCFYLIIAMTLSAMLSYAQEKPIPLYPNGIPNSKPTPAAYIENNDQGNNDQWVTKVSVPTLTPFIPAHPNGTAIVIFPGGAYAGLSMDKEGYKIARAFNDFGVTAFVVKYRLPSDDIMVDKTIGPLQDAQQAVLMVRKNAMQWGIKTDRIGIIGFSAGGHLASTEGTHFDKLVIEDKENISVRPDFYDITLPGDQLWPDGARWFPRKFNWENTLCRSFEFVQQRKANNPQHANNAVSTRHRR